uniref:Uncharacterized protein n=1 Tax=Chlorobium phaeobacteroides (strain BS1) TaxID=331678 RepID=B3EJW8_CHLPB
MICVGFLIISSIVMREKYMERKCVFMILLSVVAFLSSCEKKIEGVIVDPFGKGVENAEVEILGSTFKSKANSKGEFGVDYVPGEIIVRFTKKGFTSHQVSLNIRQKYSYPLDTLVMYPMPKDRRLYYMGKDGLIPLTLMKGVSEKRNNYGWTTT